MLFLLAALNASPPLPLTQPPFTHLICLWNASFIKAQLRLHHIYIWFQWLCFYSNTNPILV